MNRMQFSRYLLEFLSSFFLVIVLLYFLGSPLRSTEYINRKWRAMPKKEVPFFYRDGKSNFPGEINNSHFCCSQKNMSSKRKKAFGSKRGIIGSRYLEDFPFCHLLVLSKIFFTFRKPERWH